MGTQQDKDPAFEVGGEQGDGYDARTDCEEVPEELQGHPSIGHVGLEFEGEAQGPVVGAQGPRHGDKRGDCCCYLAQHCGEIKEL